MKPTPSHAAGLGRLARRNLVGVCGITVVVALITIAVFAQRLSPFDPNAQVGRRLSPPEAEHVLGLDQLGRDVLSRLIFGARVALLVSVVSIGLSLLAGVGLGLAAGYYGGVADNLIMRVMDLMFTLPSFVLAVALAGLLGRGRPSWRRARRSTSPARGPRAPATRVSCCATCCRISSRPSSSRPP
jgi:ABC-type dipeptide/oligopeptide/nickel transport system permease subunit